MELSVDRVWNRNTEDINRIIGIVKAKYGMKGGWFLESQNIFYKNFEDYYDSDKEYLKFFYTCLVNKAKNICRENAMRNRHVSTITDDGGTEISVFDILQNDMYHEFMNELHVKEVDEYFKEMLDQTEYFVYQHLLEGWNSREISKMLDCKTKEVEAVRNTIRQHYMAIA